MQSCFFHLLSWEGGSLQPVDTWGWGGRKECKAKCCSVEQATHLRQCLCAFISHQTSGPKVVAITLRAAPWWRGELPRLAWYWRQLDSSNSGCSSSLSFCLLAKLACTGPCGTVAEDCFRYMEQQASCTVLSYIIVSWKVFKECYVFHLTHKRGQGASF